jgi:hypothetical protein
MKKFSALLLLIFISGNSFLHQDIFSNPLPFTIEIETASLPGAPVIHSFAFAQSNGKWLFIGGRTNGMHGMTPTTAFPRSFANRDIFVVDPGTGQTWSRSLYADLSIQAADPLRSTNMQYVQSGNKLYLTGGYGIDTVENDFVTFPVLTVIDVGEIIQAVINGTSIEAFVKQVSDPAVQVCGGEMGISGDHLFIAGGHKFTGMYSRTDNDQVYTNQIRMFRVIESGSTVSITDLSAVTDTVELHRRDLNLVPAVKPGGSPYYIMYGGVFKYHADLPYLNPVYIDGNNVTVDFSFEQKMSQYTCALLPVFDASENDMHTTFFGGTSLYYHNNFTNQIEMDTLIPFIRDITTLTKRSDGTSFETILPIKFNELLGTNAKFILDKNIPHYANGVVKLDEIQGRIMAGYIFGGIRAINPNLTPSYASDRIFKVYITPKSVNIAQVNNSSPQNYNLSQNFPNPFNPSTRIRFDIPVSGNIRLKIFNSIGKEVETLIKENLAAGSYEVKWFGEGYASGIYFYRLEANEYVETRKMLLMK